MNKVKNTLYISLFLLLVLLLWSAVSSVAKPPAIHAVLTGGILDLSGKDLDKTIYYSDDFENYPQKLYTPHDFETGALMEPPRHLTLADYRNIDYATHRMRVKLKPGKVYGVFLRSADYSMRLFIDGWEAEPVGWPGETKETTVPRVAERSYYFKPDTEITTFIMQASNFVHREGAYPSLVYFGTNEIITRFTMIELITSMLIMGCLLTASLYHLGLFCLNRKRKTVLIFSVCCLLLAMMNNKLIPVLFPEYNWYAVFRLEYIVLYGTFGMLAFFIDSLYPAMLNRLVMRVYYTICALCILTTFVFDTKVYSALILYFEAVSVLIIVYVFVKMAMSLKSGDMKNALSFLGMTVVGMFGINDMLFHIGITFVGNIGGLAFTTPVAMVFFVFCYSLVLSALNAETEQAMLEAREKERALTEQNAMLDRLSKMRAEFMAGISHELKMPLTVMSGYAQLTSAMLDNGLNNEDMRNNLNNITDEAERLAGLVGQLLHVTRIQENKARLHPVDLNEIMTHQADAFKEACAANGNRLTLSTEGSIPPVIADEVTLNQVFSNLLSNANAHTKDGEITITAETEAAGEFAHITVTDTGIGISPEFLPHVFERYKTKSENGTGLGLAICNEIISFHGGEITVESELGKGTAVCFTLPLAKGDGTNE